MATGSPDIGDDGKPRCPWAGATLSDLTLYHDKVWGKQTSDESVMFEALTLGVFEVGLSWRVVFAKREAFVRAFRGFDVAKVAAMTEPDVDRLSEDTSIIRNRGKIQATVDNARVMVSASPGLPALTRSHAIDRKQSPRSTAQVPTTSPQADVLSKELKAQGYRFIGPTSVYAFMQNIGVVNDHIRGCFRAIDYQPPRRANH